MTIQFLRISCRISAKSRKPASIKLAIKVDHVTGSRPSPFSHCCIISQQAGTGSPSKVFVTCSSSCSVRVISSSWSATVSMIFSVLPRQQRNFNCCSFGLSAGKVYNVKGNAIMLQNMPHIL